ncbi:sporulation protein SsgA [Actinomadura sp. NBRC 104425]|uniref:hypothetical protein n=1 Tax=Actinomadura sp. NBRC 104425 TaxID=3032204 RepID=UPI0024A34605|nr:hypothetical protein [Actinomadura sp. NBRC 104425]GLZ15654.1 sporulation protein SsgA [Actinomadura sp. NBRC 104425]
MATRSIERVGGAALERAAVSAVSKVGTLAPPWAILGITWPVAWIGHAGWGDGQAAAWMSMGGTAATIGLGALTWVVSHSRDLLGRLHSTATTTGATLWGTVAIITGPDHPATLGVYYLGGISLAASWNIRKAIRSKDPQSDTDKDPMGSLFDRAKERFGLKNAQVKTLEVDGRRIKGTLQLPPGERTQSEMLRKTEELESGLRFPPGSVVLAPDEDDASRMHITVTDPRVMKRPIPWPGPSKPGASIAEPLRLGVYQDGTEALFHLVGVHIQVMGMTGSGKSIGAFRNIAAEVITRQDAVLIVVDLAKSTQTVGPLLNGIARFVETKAELVEFIRTLVRDIPERTAYLAEHGYQKWQSGCGLTYQVIFIEEAAKVFDELGSRDEELLLQALKEARSAGVSIILSMQRADYTQMPTIARAQLARMTFGVASSEDASFGLSERQQAADASPELWANHQPGMCYLDAPGVPETHYAMPLRTYAWGSSDQEADAAAKEHAARYPASRLTLDKWTARLIGDGRAVSEGRTEATQQQGGEMRRDYCWEDEPDNGDDLGDVGDAIAEYTSEPETDPDLARITGREKIQEPSNEEAERFVIPEPTGQKLSAAAARELVHDWLRFRARGGRPTFTASDPELLKVRDATGNRSRAWAYKVLRELTDLGVLEADDSEATTRYTITDLSALDRETVAV